MSACSIQSLRALLITLFSDRLRQPPTVSAKCWLSTRRTSRWWRTTRSWPVRWGDFYLFIYLTTLFILFWRFVIKFSYWSSVRALFPDNLIVFPIWSAAGVDPPDHPLAGEPDPGEDGDWHAGQAGRLQRLPLRPQTPQGNRAPQMLSTHTMTMVSHFQPNHSPYSKR